MVKKWKYGLNDKCFIRLIEENMDKYKLKRKNGENSTQPLYTDGFGILM